MTKHKKNYSISTSCYNTQRNSKETKINTKNKNNKNNYLYSPKKNKIEKNMNNNKSLIVPEYKIKLENIKSRVSELLNIYSLLALRSININNGCGKNEIHDEENENNGHDA